MYNSSQNTCTASERVENSLHTAGAQTPTKQPCSAGKPLQEHSINRKFRLCSEQLALVLLRLNHLHRLGFTFATSSPDASTTRVSKPASNCPGGHEAWMKVPRYTGNYGTQSCGRPRSSGSYSGSCGKHSLSVQRWLTSGVRRFCGTSLSKQDPQPHDKPIQANPKCPGQAHAGEPRNHSRQTSKARV